MPLLRLLTDEYREEINYLCSDNANSCYDRTLRSITLISMQQDRLLPEPIICIFKTLQDMKHYTKTVHGVSERFYDCTRNQGKSVQGFSKANGASSTIWVLKSLSLLTITRNLGFGVSFHTPISS